MTAATRDDRTITTQTPEHSSAYSLNRRSILRSTVALGAGGLALLARPSIARADATASMALITPDGAGDGSTNDAGALQDAIDEAIGLMLRFDNAEPTIDLQGLTYLFRTPLTIEPRRPALKTPKCRLRIVNGTLLSDIQVGHSPTNAAVIIRRNDASGSGEYPEISFEGVRIQKKQYPGIVGMLVERGLRCSFIQCAFEARNIFDTNGVPKAGAFETGILLQGTQICNFIDCHFAGNDNHVVFDVGYPGGTSTGPSTDCRFYGCSFSESSQSAIVARAPAVSSDYPAAQCLFHGCSIETSRSAPLIDLDSVRNAKFHSCRFELENDTHFGLVSLNNCSDTRFFDCNFSPSSGYDCITEDSSTDGTSLVGNVFPASPGVTLSGTYRCVANSNVTDA